MNNLHTAEKKDTESVFALDRRITVLLYEIHVKI
jgi:hypothetical protein